MRPRGSNPRRPGEIPTGAHPAGRPRSAEFAFYGPPAFDVGSLFANLIFAALRHANRPAQAAILALLNECWSAYVAALAPSGDAAEGGALAAPQAVRRLLQETAGFCGCELIRRVVGAAHVDDLETISDAQEKVRAEQVALALGSALLKGRDALASVDGILDMLHAAVRGVAEQ